MSNYGFKVSKDGYNVKTATPDQLAVSSAYLSEKVAYSGVLTHHHTGTSSSTTITHNLGYVPQIKVYAFEYGVYFPAVFGDTTGAFIALDCYATSTTVVIRTTESFVDTFDLTILFQILLNST